MIARQCARRRVTLVFGLLLIAPAWSAAQEPTEPERLYAQLAESDEPGAKPLAQRWRVLVRQRIWSDASGKYKVYARYVDHDPNFESVTLLILQKKGDQQSYKEGTIPLAKLGKTEQTLVRRIAQVREEVEMKLAGKGSGALEAGEGVASEGMEGELAGGELERGYEGYEGAEPDVEAPLPPEAMMEPWRGDFAQFASNLSGSQEEGGKWAVSFGSLAPLQMVYDMERSLAELRKKPEAERPPQPLLMQQAMALGWSRGGLGKVYWEVTLTSPIAGPGAKIEHDLAAPEPFTVTLVAGEASGANFAKLKAGAKVRLAGYFKSLGGDGEKPEIVLQVRPMTMSGSSAESVTARRRP